MRVNRGSRRVGSGLTEEVRTTHKPSKGHLYRISGIDKTFDNFPGQDVIFLRQLGVDEENEKGADIRCRIGNFNSGVGER